MMNTNTLEENRILTFEELDSIVGGFIQNGGAGTVEAIINEVHHEVYGLIAKYYHDYEYVALNAVDADLVRAERYVDKKKYAAAIGELEGAAWGLGSVKDPICPVLIARLTEGIKILKTL